MLLSTCSLYWERVLDSVLPLVDGLGLIMLAWVASRVRSTSKVVQSTSQEVEATLIAAHTLLGRNVSAPDAPDQKRS